MRSKKAASNIASALVLQIITIICGFILPRLIITNYGSGINGMVSAISQFLGYIALAEAGVGGVIRATLYKPLAANDNTGISGIIKATELFFRLIAIIFLGYALVIAICFPLLNDSGMDWNFSFSLVLIIAISTFFEYYFGITNSILLQADQKQYIASVLSAFTTILFLIIASTLILSGFSIHIVRLFSAFVFIIKPFALRMYVRKRYRLDYNCQPDKIALKHKWDGLSQHIAFFLRTNTDMVVLTLFTNFLEVSVYSVHFLIVSGLRRIVMIFTNGFESAFGNMMAKHETEVLSRNFRIYELISSSVTVIIFTTAGLLINQFIELYTRGVTDVNYQRHIFASILLLSEAVYCFRQPYHSIIIAAGHFRQTNKFAYLEAGVNIALSIILVIYFGLVGVAIGTLVAVTIRTVQSALYLRKNLLKRSFKIFVVRLIISVSNAAIIIAAVRVAFKITTFDSYVKWGIYGVSIVLIACFITIAFSLVFYRTDVINTIGVIKRLFLKMRRPDSVNEP